MSSVLLSLIVFTYVLGVESGCSKSDWGISFDVEGTSQCTNPGYFINGFYRSNPDDTDDIYHLEGAECCYPTSPWEGNDLVKVTANWGITLDYQGWAFCPMGYYLYGLYRTVASVRPSGLHNIEYGHCAKPRNHPDENGHCYTQDVVQCLDQEGLCRCNDGYFVVGLYRGGCDKLLCLEYLQCCRFK